MGGFQRLLFLNSTIHHCGFSDYVGLGIVAVMTIVVCRNLSKSSVIFHVVIFS